MPKFDIAKLNVSYVPDEKLPLEQRVEQELSKEDLIERVKKGYCPSKKLVSTYIKQEVEKINEIMDF